MVQFNNRVKVLGYYLSDDERTLKRQWSQENYERMMTFKKQVRRNRIMQQQKELIRPKSVSIYSSRPLTTIELKKGDYKGLGSTKVHHCEQPQEDPAEVTHHDVNLCISSNNNNINQQIQDRKHQELLQQQQQQLLLQQQQQLTEVRLKRPLHFGPPRSKAQKECDRVTGSIVSFFSENLSYAITKVKELEKNIALDAADVNKDLDPFICLKNLVIPEFHL